MMNQASARLVYKAGEDGWHLRKQQPDGSLVEPAPEEHAVANALAVARAFEWLHGKCKRCGPFENELPKIIDEADVLLANLTELQRSLVDSAIRERLASSHLEAVTYAGEVAPSYVEAIYRAGERMYATINMLCRHGKLFPYLSRLHPASSEKISEQWPAIPRVDEIEFTGPNGRGNHCPTPVHLLGAICKAVKNLSSIDPDQAMVFLNKEIAACQADPVAECYVTLTQIGAIMGNASKRTARRLYDDNILPVPDIPGGAGRAHKWRWSAIRPILEKEIGRNLPVVFPADRFARN